MIGGDISFAMLIEQLKAGVNNFVAGFHMFSKWLVNAAN